MGPLSPNSTYLLLDAATPTTQVGLLHEGAFTAFSSTDEAPLASLFTQAQSLMKEHNLGLESLSGLIYCQGPGSILGVRLTLMAIRTWKRTHPHLQCYTYNSLALGSALVSETHTSEAFTFIAPGRQQRWHTLNNNQQKEIPADALGSLTGPIYTLPQRKKSFCLPTDTHIIDYDLASHAKLFNKEGLLTLTDAPETFNQTEATYKTWKPDRHR